MRFVQLMALLGVLTFHTSTALAADKDAGPGAVELAVGGVASNLDAGAQALVMFDLSRSLRLGLRLRGLGVRKTYVAGFEEDDGSAVEGLPFMSVRVARLGRAELRLHVGVGARQMFLDSTRDDASTRLLTEFGPMVHWQLDPAWRLEAGWIQRADLELSPTTDLAVLGSVFRLRTTARLGGRWSMYASGEFGGVFGYGGDNEKIQVRGSVGLQVALDAPLAPEASAPDEATGSIGGFVSLEWRALLLGGHVSHGPGFSAGVSFFDGLLRLGLTGFARPGPINPETFDIVPSTGEPYKGQNTLSLRSDGGFIGLLVESDLPLWGVDGLRIIPTFAFGNAAFGFYLTGDDRETPDGRRVSAWEDELQDGRDAGTTLAIEPGLRLAWRIPGSVVRPYVAARYMVLFGYDAYAKESYNGLSFAGGVEFVF